MIHPTYFALDKKGFTYMEIIVATMIIILVGVGMYRINSFFLNNSTDNRRITIVNQFSKYVASIVNTNPVPEDFSIVPNQAFYIEAFPDSFQYTIDPNKKTGNLGFFWNSFSGQKEYWHEIRFIGTGSLAGVGTTFKYFQATVSYEWKNLSFKFRK
jgi:hypothetical protein